MENKSDIARIRALIQDEYRSGYLALHGAALGTTQHKFMTARTENIARLYSELGAKYGDQAVFQTMMEMGDHTIETAGQQVS